MGLTLFAECVLPGCTALVTEVGEACDDCLESGFVRHNPGGRRMTEADIDERDESIRRAYEALSLIKDPAARARIHIVDHRERARRLMYADSLVGAETRGRDEIDGRRIESVSPKGVFL